MCFFIKGLNVIFSNAFQWASIIHEFWLFMGQIAANSAGSSVRVVTKQVLNRLDGLPHLLIGQLLYFFFNY